MKAIFSRLTLATLLPVLASCTNYYKSPSNDPTTHAVITNNIVVMGVARHETYRVYAVDGRPIHI